MLGIRGRTQADLRENQVAGIGLPVQWVGVEDVDPAAADSSPTSVHDRGFAKRRFQRL